MYATKEDFRQYLFSPARQYMSFQAYLNFITAQEGSMEEQIEKGHQAVRDLEQLMTSRERLATLSACMVLLQLAVHLDQRASEGAA